MSLASSSPSSASSNQDAGFHSEKALYKLPEDPVTAENIQSLADEIEQTIHKAASAHAQIGVKHVCIQISLLPGAAQ
jgi:hypothetical protein